MDALACGVQLRNLGAEAGGWSGWAVLGWLSWACGVQLLDSGVRVPVVGSLRVVFGGSGGSGGRDA